MTEQEYITLMERAIEEKNPFGADRRWQKIMMPDCVCANGEPYCCYVKKGSTRHLIVFMIGGGLLWDKKSAAYPATPKTLAAELPGLYTSTVIPANDYWFFALRDKNGILSDDEANPFRDWNIGMINYGTGDFHLGANELKIETLDNGKTTVHCQGLHNLHACMEIFKETFAEPDKLLLCGESAGGFSVPGVAEEILSYYPSCDDITLFTDSALMLRRDWKSVAAEVWQIPEYLSAAIHSEDIVADWYERLYKIYGDKLGYMYACGIQDVAMAQFQSHMDGGAFEVMDDYLNTLPAKLRMQCKRLGALTDKFAFYYHNFPDESGKGSQHTTLSFPSFIDEMVDGVSPAEWLCRGVNKQYERIGLDLL